MVTIPNFLFSKIFKVFNFLLPLELFHDYISYLPMFGILVMVSIDLAITTPPTIYNFTPRIKLCSRNGC